MTDFVIKEGSSIITPDVNGFYRIGNLSASGSRNFTVTAQTTTCTSDSLRINMGYGCTGYPESFVEESCTESQWLVINNLPSQIQLSVSQQPSMPQKALCEVDTVAFVINSSRASYVDNPKFRVVLPTGVDIVEQEMEYPLGSDNWETIVPTISGGMYIYNVEDHSGVSSKGLPGTAANPGSQGRRAQLRLVYNTTCEFVNNSRFLVQQVADRPCGTVTPNQLGNNR